MNSARQLRRSPTDWLRESQLAPYIDAFTHHLTERRYAAHTVGTYVACLAHFARWASRCRMDIHRIDEDVVQRFLDDHLPRCDCARPVRGTRRDLRAALRHLLVVLRANAVIAERPPGTSPVDEELRRFDDHMNQVRGLAPKTRSLFLRTVRRLLLEQFGDRPVVILAIKPEDVRRFVTRQSELYSSPASAGTLASALRGYFRFRASCGDPMHGLIGVVSYPANWQLASLPQALSGVEVERLLRSLGRDGPSSRRADAIVRKAIHQAYARAGLPYTRAHLLRHTLASRLLDGGSSLKEVADVLRHRSLNTTLIYAKLDSRNLAAVALPWPGCAS